MSRCDDEKSIHYIYKLINKILFIDKNEQMTEIKPNYNTKLTKTIFIKKFILLSLYRKQYNDITQILKAVYRLKYNKNIDEF